MEKKLDQTQALIEAERCLYCYDAPCEKACPAHVPVPEFIQSIRSGNIKGARELVSLANPSIEVCGEVCPEEQFCQSVCTRAKIDSPIKIRELHKFVTDNVKLKDLELDLPPLNGKKVAIIGGGPAGLACARELRRYGIKSVIFEKKELGGIPVQEISKERLSDEISRGEAKQILELFDAEVRDKKITSLNELGNEFDAVFIGTGLTEELELDVKGVNIQSVYTARKLLKTIKSGMKTNLGKRIGVIGGGNVAVEVAAALKREDPSRDVEVVYRRGLKELRAFKDEIEEALELGVAFQFLAIPIEIKGTEKVEGLVLRRARLGEPDASGRRTFEEVPNSDFFIPFDSIVIAIGQKPSDVFSELEKTNNGLIKVNENLETSKHGVFAGGDIVRGASTIVEAVSDGKKAAQSILKYIEGGKNV
ncbi:FAD-dependent oxidoreductase [Caldisericum sp. AR60]|uniref:FAD-dependent oxidoreductase n=1 Tax=Caldisericum sp. AR60 TaxID=3397852 RepID=UPI0039FC1BE7